MALPIYRALAKAFPEATFEGYDPVVFGRGCQGFSSASTRCRTLKSAFAGADLVMVLNNHPEFREMDMAALATAMNRPGHRLRSVEHA